VPQVEVTFDIDANGIVNVHAKDKATGKEQQIRIQASGGLSEADIERMVKDAEEHAGEDKKRRELVEAKNQADGLIHQTEKTLSDLGDKVPAGEKSGIEAAVADLKKAREGDDVEDIKKKLEALAQVSMKLGEAMYKQQGPEAGGPSGGASPGGEAGGAGGGKPGDPGVVDADFEEVKDDKKKSA
jgi:molecular chaperone DnaK